MSRPRHCRTRQRARSSRRTAATPSTAAHASSAATCTCWSPGTTRGERRAGGGARSPAWPRCCTPTRRTCADGLAENVAAQVLAIAPGDYRHILRPATAFGKNVAAARRRLLDVAQISRHHRGRIARHLRAPDLRRQRDRHRAVAAIAIKVITVRTTGFDAARGDGRQRRGRNASRRRPTAGKSQLRRPGAHQVRPARADRRARSSSPAAAAWAAARTSRCSSRWPTSSARPSARRAPRSTRATCPND